MKFPFTAEIYLNGVAFNPPQEDAQSGYTVEGHKVSFELGHNERIVLPNIPINAVVIIQEQNHEGFTVLHRLDSEEDLFSGAVREVQISNTPRTIHFINQTGFRLPNTGGTGTKSYILSGTVLMMGAALLYMIQKRKIYVHKNG